MNTPTDMSYRTVQRNAEEYQSTVHALLAFSAYVVHTGSAFRPGGHFGFGRRMKASEDNVSAASGEVTPDLVAQKDSSYGMVAEVKRSTSRYEAEWTRHLEQLRKYDDDLAGWWTDTEHVATWNAAILIHQSRSRQLVQAVHAARADDESTVGSNSTVIEFNLSNEVDPYIFFRVEWGEIKDSDLRPRLHDGVQVPRDRVLQSFPSVKFYDAEPPLPWLITLLWTDVLAANWNPEAFDPKIKAFPISVSVAQLTDELQRAYGSAALERDQRSAEFPKQKWIRRALDALVGIQHAIQGDDSGEYTVHYRPYKTDILQKFTELLQPPVVTDMPQPGQLDLALGEPQ